MPFAKCTTPDVKHSGIFGVHSSRGVVLDHVLALHQVWSKTTSTASGTSPGAFEGLGLTDGLD